MLAIAIEREKKTKQENQREHVSNAYSVSVCNVQNAKCMMHMGMQLCTASLMKMLPKRSITPISCMQIVHEL